MQENKPSQNEATTGRWRPLFNSDQAQPQPGAEPEPKVVSPYDSTDYPYGFVTGEQTVQKQLENLAEPEDAETTIANLKAALTEMTKVEAYGISETAEEILAAEIRRIESNIKAIAAGQQLNPVDKNVVLTMYNRFDGGVAPNQDEQEARTTAGHIQKILEGNSGNYFVATVDTQQTTTTPGRLYPDKSPYAVVLHFK